MNISSQGGESTEALKGKLNFEQSKNRIIGRDGNNNPRMSIVANGSDFSFKVSKQGDNVLTANPLNLIFNSDNNLFKIMASGEFGLFMPAMTQGQRNTVSSTVPHNLGFIPLVLAWIHYPDVQAVGQGSISQFGGSTVWPRAGDVTTGQILIGELNTQTIRSRIDHVYFEWFKRYSDGVGSPAINATVKYYLISETQPYDAPV